MNVLGFFSAPHSLWITITLNSTIYFINLPIQAKVSFSAEQNNLVEIRIGGHIVLSPWSWILLTCKSRLFRKIVHKVSYNCSKIPMMDTLIWVFFHTLLHSSSSVLGSKIPSLKKVLPSICIL